LNNNDESFDMTEQSQIHLILQYYRAASPGRQGEIDTCLRENLQNRHLTAVHLLTEEGFALPDFPNLDKIHQTIIGERLTYEKAFLYANDWPEPVIWILANADIYFDDSLRFLHEADLMNTMFALTRHDVQPDGSIKLVPSEVAHGCQDAWMFVTPVHMERMCTQFYMGIPGCDHRIAHEFVKAGYIVLNPSLRIIARHLDISNDSDINTRIDRYVSLFNEESYRSGKAVSPPHQHFLYPTDELLSSVHALFVRNLALYEAKHQLEVKKDELAVKIDRLEAEKTELTTEKVQSQAKKAQLLRDIHEMKRVTQGRDIKIHALENSLSWRLTEPLRRLGSVFPFLMKLQKIGPVTTSGKPIDLDVTMASAKNKKKSKSSILVLDFNLGGGSNLYSRSLIVNMEREGHNVIVLEYRYGTRDYQIEFNSVDEVTETIISADISEVFPEILQKMVVNFIVISQLISWPETGKVLAVLKESKVPYVVLMHDYFMVCPNWTLFDYREKFCGIPDDPAICDKCLEKIRDIDIPIEQHTVVKRIEPWRRNAEAFLKKAEKVICFSDACAQNIKKACLQFANIVVNEHCIPEQHLFHWQQRSFNSEQGLTVAVVGGISIAKGSKFLDKLVDSPGFKEIPVKIVLIGEINPPPRYERGKNASFIIHGSYSRSELGALLERYNASLVMIPSQWPETFCYTASEALLLGYPVLCFDLGAQAARIRRYNCGWVAGEPYVDGVLNVFKEILANPDIVREKSLQSRNYIPPSAKEHFSNIVEIFDRVSC
jgi:glycosyltransferase involved in cell wall biosynthesis